MFRPLIAGITALSLSFATTTPLQAQEMSREDVNKLLIGLAAVAVIGAAIEGNKNNDDARSTPVRNRNDWSGINRNNDWSSFNRPQQSNRNSRRVLPHDCLRTVQTRFGSQRLFGQQCMERNYRHVNRLPARCAVRVYTDNGPRRGFDPLCLREQGFRSDRRN